VLITDTSTRPTLGPYVLTRRLPPGVLGDRWLALHTRTQTSHVVNRFGFGREAIDRTKFLDVMNRAATLNHAHILKVEYFDIDERGKPMAVTQFVGDRDGVLTLEVFLRAKGGSLSVEEVKRAAEQLLSAVAYAQSEGCPHGPLSMHEVLVSRRGSLQIELYGVARMLGHPENDLAEQQRREVQSVMAIIYQLITGFRVEEPVIPASRIIRDLPAGWDNLFETGLAEPGFMSGAHALSALKACATRPSEPWWSLGRAQRLLHRIMLTS